MLKAIVLLAAVILVVAPPVATAQLVTICHKPGTKNETKHLPAADAAHHVADHGDTYGPCAST